MKGAAHLPARPVNAPVTKWRVSACFKRKARPRDGAGLITVTVHSIDLSRLRKPNIVSYIPPRARRADLLA